MSETVCCVCNRPLGPEVRWLGGRPYCERHHFKVTHERPGVWRAGMAHILGQIAFVLLVVALAGLLRPTLSGWSLVGTGLFLSFIPALLWLAFFYQQDRLEPEPKGYVLSVFLLGALLAQGAGIPLLNEVFEVHRWLPTSPWVNLLGSVLVVGLTEEFLKYAAVRYSVYRSMEFDERMDGIIYGTAAGLGYATMLNVNYVVSSGGGEPAGRGGSDRGDRPGAGQFRRADWLFPGGGEIRGRADMVAAQRRGAGGGPQRAVQHRAGRTDHHGRQSGRWGIQPLAGPGPGDGGGSGNLRCGSFSDPPGQPPHPC